MKIYSLVFLTAIFCFFSDIYSMEPSTEPTTPESTGLDCTFDDDDLKITHPKNTTVYTQPQQSLLKTVSQQALPLAKRACDATVEMAKNNLQTDTTKLLDKPLDELTALDFHELTNLVQAAFVHKYNPKPTLLQFFNVGPQQTPLDDPSNQERIQKIHAKIQTLKQEINKEVTLNESLAKSYIARQADALEIISQREAAEQTQAHESFNAEVQETVSRFLSDLKDAHSLLDSSTQTCRDRAAMAACNLRHLHRYAHTRAEQVHDESNCKHYETLKSFKGYLQSRSGQKKYKKNEIDAAAILEALYAISVEQESAENNDLLSDTILLTDELVNTEECYTILNQLYLHRDTTNKRNQDKITKILFLLKKDDESYNPHAIARYKEIQQRILEFKRADIHGKIAEIDNEATTLIAVINKIKNAKRSSLEQELSIITTNADTLQALDNKDLGTRSTIEPQTLSFKKSKK